MTKDEALRLALEALEMFCEHGSILRPIKTRDAIKAALEAKGEPVANSSAWFALVMNAAAELEDASHCLRDEDAKQVAIRGAKYYREQAHTLYTTPPQRTWVGLTKEERHAISMANRPYCADIMAAHEEELKRRNT